MFRFLSTPEIGSLIVGLNCVLNSFPNTPLRILQLWRVVSKTYDTDTSMTSCTCGLVQTTSGISSFVSLIVCTLPLNSSREWGLRAIFLDLSISIINNRHEFGTFRRKTGTDLTIDGSLFFSLSYKLSFFEFPLHQLNFSSKFDRFE